ncbi:MAG TPA: hypothetical protein VHU18_03445 [Rhizomicrobium sp.]|jgi:hypothetical protein|nr:hypothetical protein [Rhizomicrobium sp.]
MAWARLHLLGIAFFWLFTTVAAAQNRQFIDFRQVGEAASADEVEAAVGQIDYAMDDCLPDHLAASFESWQRNPRKVRATLSKPGANWRDPQVLRALLRGGAKAADDLCPLNIKNIMGQLSPDHTIGEFDVYASPAAGAAQQLVMRAQSFLAILGYTWESVEDVERENQAAAQAAAAQAEQERRNEEWARERQLQAQREAAESAPYKLVFWLLVLAGVIFWNRERLMRLYYSLTPHPASAVLSQALTTNSPLNEHSFEAAMRDLPTNRYEREVRHRQADKLKRRATEHASALRKEAERLRRKAQEDAAVIRDHTELAEAAVAAELEKARVSALRKRVRE